MDTLTITLKEFRKSYQNSQTICSEIKSREEKLEDLNTQMKNEFIPYVRKVYKDWRPQIGEIVVSINLSSDWVYEQVVSEINGSLVRVKDSPDSYSRIDLDIKKDDYASLTFVLPLSAYNYIKTILTIKQYSKLKLTKQDILSKIHPLPL